MSHWLSGTELSAVPRPPCDSLGRSVGARQCRLRARGAWSLPRNTGVKQGRAGMKVLGKQGAGGSGNTLTEKSPPRR